MSKQKKLTPLGSKQRIMLTGINDNLGKIPPQALELEEVVLGAIMLDVDSLPLAAPKLMNIDSFYKDAHQRIYSACLDLLEDGHPIDILTVVERLKEKGELEIVGGAHFISKLTSRVNSAANIEFHCTIIFQKALKRRLIALGGDILNDAYEDQTDVFQLIDETLLNLQQVNKDISSLGTKGIQQHAQELAKEIKEARESDNEIMGITTGLREYDRVTGGRVKGNLYIEAGRPGMGKTAKLLSEIRAQLEAGERVAIFSVEMPGKQLISRLVSQDLNMYYGLLRNPKKLNEEDNKRVMDRIAWYERNQNLMIEDKGGLTPNQARSKLLEFGATIAFFDYLQLMKGDKRNYKSKEEQVSDISGNLKIIAKDFDIPVVALAQLSREVEKRPSKIPQLSDLRDSGAIEQDADLVVFLFRPDYYRITNSGYKEGAIILIIGKNRHGEDDLEMEVEFHKQTMTVRDFPPDEVPEFNEADF